MKIRLIGPGGAGKSTVGRLLSDVLGARFVDLDLDFVSGFGDPGRYIEAFGYRSYAAANVDVYLHRNAEDDDGVQVIALSSGFMAYPIDVHRAYAKCRAEIISGANSFVLLPSFDLETCVRETVRRQMGRPFARSAEREEQVIRQRFDLYRSLGVEIVETTRPPADVVRDVRSRVRLLR